MNKPNSEIQLSLILTPDVKASFLHAGDNIIFNNHLESVSVLAVCSFKVIFIPKVCLKNASRH